MKKIDITGKKYNRLKVIEESHRDKYGFIMWKCLCDCGKVVFARSYLMKTEVVKSCGCLNDELRKSRQLTHGKSSQPIYKVWKSMKARCFNKNDKRYHRYGGRGISVCNDWLNDPLSFINWAENNGYKTGLTIDRKDNDKGYYPSNCRWVSIGENNRNSSNCKVNKKIAKEIRDVCSNTELRQSDIADIFGITQQTVSKIKNHKIWR